MIRSYYLAEYHNILNIVQMSKDTYKKITKKKTKQNKTLKNKRKNPGKTKEYDIIDQCNKINLSIHAYFVFDDVWWKNVE